MNYADAFHHLKPGFFQQDDIASTPEDEHYTELIMDLTKPLPVIFPPSVPENITFGRYSGDIARLRAAVNEVDEDWIQYFNEGDDFYCAFDGEKIVAFCTLSDMGSYNGLRIGSPGCVGTIPAYREQGIGLRLVHLATEELKKTGFHLSWVHYTYLDQWYMKLGYQPILRWNCKGIL